MTSSPAAPEQAPTPRGSSPVDPGHGSPRAFALVLVGAALWGTGGLAGAGLAQDGLSMLTVATVRLGIGGGALLVVLAVLGRVRRVPFTAAVVRRVALTGLLAAAYQASYFLAVQATSVSVATLVALGAAPVLVAAATTVASRRHPGGRTVTAVLLAVAGLVLLVGLRTGGASPGGAALALAAAAAFATMTVVNATAPSGLDPLALTALSFTLGAALLVPVALAAGIGEVPSAAPGWLLMAYLGIGPTALAYGAYFAGLRGVPATTASVLALVEPLTAALGAALLRGERLGAAGLVGAALLAAAVVVLRPRRAAPTMVVGLR